MKKILPGRLPRLEREVMLDFNDRFRKEPIEVLRLTRSVWNKEADQENPLYFNSLLVFGNLIKNTYKDEELAHKACDLIVFQYKLIRNQHLSNSIQIPIVDQPTYDAIEKSFSSDRVGVTANVLDDMAETNPLLENYLNLTV